MTEWVRQTSPYANVSQTGEEEYQGEGYVAMSLPRAYSGYP